MDTTSHATPESSSPAKYFVVWFALLILTATTYGVSRLDLGGFNLPVALLIATVKATLVALVFMHLWQHRGSVRLVLLVALCFVALLTTLTLTDFATRFTPSISPGGTRSTLPVNSETVDTPGH